MNWSETFKQIAQSDENWDDFDITLIDGLEDDCDEPPFGQSRTEPNYS